MTAWRFGRLSGIIISLALAVCTVLAPALAQQADINAINKAFQEHFARGDFPTAQVEAQKLEQAVKARFGTNHVNYAVALNNLAIVYEKQGKYAEAEGLYKRTLAIMEEALSTNHPDVAQVLNNLAIVYDSQGKYAEAEGLYKRALAIYEQALGANHPDVAQTLNNLAVLYRNQGKYAEAEGLFKRALAIREQALGANHPDVAQTLNNLANLHTNRGKYAEAEGLYKRALAIREQALGASHPDVADTLNNLALVYRNQGKYAEAEGLYKRALAIYKQTLGANHPGVAQTLNNLAVVDDSQGKYAEAEGLYKRALAIYEQALGANHPSAADTLNNLALMYANQGKYAEAEGLYKRALAIYEQTLGANHPTVALTLDNLGFLFGRMGDSRMALAYSRKASAAVVAHASADAGGAGQRERSGGLVEQRAGYFVRYVANLALAARQNTEPEPAAGREAIEVAQWAIQSSAGTAVQQMAARFASGSGALGTLVRESQDFTALWRQRDKALTEAVSKPEGQRSQASIDSIRRQIIEIEGKLAANAGRLEKEFPDYAALANPKPLSVGGVQAELGAGEALVMFLAAEFKPAQEQTFIWVVTKTDFRWVRVDLGTKALTERVQRLRVGLDRNARSRAAVQIGEASPAARGFLPFDLAVAHELYAALFGQIEDLIKDKQLLIVPSGPLTSLPFQVLITEQPEQAVPETIEGYAAAAWLAKRNAITVLPSVASLAALRQHARGSRAPDPYLGFGNPLLVGASGSDRRAWSVEPCGGTNKRIQVAALAAPERRGVSEFFRGDAANVVAVRSLAPLPETAEELCEVGRQLGADDKAIAIGQAATETAVKAMSADGRLARARIVHFATHGLIAGELKGLAEPALVLTPPADGADASALQKDDGLLTASEVAQLKLNADWVVLSACNTAAGEGNAEALSGLARAFFYAGARAPLVSHWPVNSGAAVKLTTRAFAALEQNPDIGRAEALRQAMLATIAEGGPQAHPSYWAPFVVVGEGARL